MASILWYLLFFLILVSILITIHELGHFLAARYFGVKVYRFSIGFGPVLWKHTTKDGVEYAISIISLGGYIRMKGEADNFLQGGGKKKISWL